MKATILLLCVLAAPVPGQAILSPPANYVCSAATPWVPVEWISLADVGNGALGIRWEPTWALTVGIPDPRLATVTELYVGVYPNTSPPSWPEVTPFGLAYASAPVLCWLVTPAMWLENTSTGTLLAQIPVPVSSAPAVQVTLQALAVHRFGAPDVAYLSPPATLTL